jgi:hypothetical protein
MLTERLCLQTQDALVGTLPASVLPEWSAPNVLTSNYQRRGCSLLALHPLCHLIKATLLLLFLFTLV